MLNGIFAFALFDKEKNHFLIARDHIGIIPSYIKDIMKTALFL